MNKIALPFDDLNLPPALVFECRTGEATSRLLDPVEVVLLRHKHPDLEVRVIPTHPFHKSSKTRSH